VLLLLFDTSTAESVWCLMLMQMCELCTVCTGCADCRAWHLKFRKQVSQEEVGLHNDDDLPTIDIMIPW
jgi:hypothetical protein